MIQPKKKRSNPSEHCVEDGTNEVIDDFVYLGVNIAKTRREDAEIQRGTTRRVRFALLASFTSRDVHRETNL